MHKENYKGNIIPGNMIEQTLNNFIFGLKLFFLYFNTPRYIREITLFSYFLLAIQPTNIFYSFLFLNPFDLPYSSCSPLSSNSSKFFYFWIFFRKNKKSIEFFSRKKQKILQPLANNNAQAL